jgi:diacylglycerol kinase (ATP)
VPRSTIDLIVNPASGPTVRGLARGARLEFAARVLEAEGATVRATATCAAGDAAVAVRRAVEALSDLVVVWGGDGTVNEVASGLIGHDVPLAIVPGGSGNGFARALGVPLHAGAALRLALEGQSRLIDTGLAGTRRFFNIAGIGFDAGVARRFNASGSRRGLVPYLWGTGAELRAHQATCYDVRLDGQPWFVGDAHLVATANGQQYGHNARIAPWAALDDGWLDVVVVPDITTWRVIRHGWRLFAGSVARVPGVRTGRAKRVDIRIAEARLLHLDGEVYEAGASARFEIDPASLLVRTP